MGNNLDVLCMVAHPDDAEILAGGTLIKLVDLGYGVGIVDFSQGEMGSRGSAKERAREAICAAGIMGIEERVNLKFPDAHIENTVANRQRVVEVIRACRPHLIITHDTMNRNPDHTHTSALVREAAFTAGLAKYDTAQPPHRPNKIIFAMEYYETEPTFVVNISGQFERKLAAIACYRSQTHNPSYKGAKTYISTKRFEEDMEARFRYYGAKIHCDYGEAFRTEAIMEIEDPVREIALRAVIPGQGGRNAGRGCGKKAEEA